MLWLFVFPIFELEIIYFWVNNIYKKSLYLLSMQSHCCLEEMTELLITRFYVVLPLILWSNPRMSRWCGSSAVLVKHTRSVCSLWVSDSLFFITVENLSPTAVHSRLKFPIINVKLAPGLTECWRLDHLEDWMSNWWGTIAMRDTGLMHVGCLVYGSNTPFNRKKHVATVCTVCTEL